jgi:hypothetical protein
MAVHGCCFFSPDRIRRQVMIHEKGITLYPETFITGGIAENPENCRSQNSYYSRIYIGE